MKIHYFTLALAVVLSGCALTRDQISLKYDPMMNVEKIANAQSVGVKVAVTDNREIKDRVSCKKNGYGMEMANITCENDLAALVKEALDKELQNRGFALRADSPTVLIDVELSKFYNNFKMRFWAWKSVSEAQLGVKVQKPNEPSYFSKTIVGKAVNKDAMLASGKNARITLEAALQHAVVQLVEDPQFINALLNTSNLPAGQQTEPTVEQRTSDT